LLTNALWCAVLLIPAMVVLRYGVIAREEAYLERRFGDNYRLYRAATRRWV
jgi:protein-S-isoprenylcysteine O-methyltransferase Ste14